MIYPFGIMYTVILAMLSAMTMANTSLDQPLLASSSAVQPQPSGAAGPSIPKNYGVVLFPDFQALDVFGPLDALNLLSRNYTMHLSVIAETKDPVWTFPGASLTNNPNSKFGQQVLPTHTFDDESPPPLDVLIVPGGVGTRVPNLNSTIDYIASRYPDVQYLIGICTGVGLVARTGILDGKRVTTNKKAWNSTTALRPEVNWVPKARWVVDGNIWTSSGVSAGIDIIFAFIEHLYGPEQAEWLANSMEYERHRDPNWDPFSEIWGVTDG